MNVEHTRPEVSTGGALMRSITVPQVFARTHFAHRTARWLFERRSYAQPSITQLFITMRYFLSHIHEEAFSTTHIEILSPSHEHAVHRTIHPDAKWTWSPLSASFNKLRLILSTAMLSCIFNCQVQLPTSRRTLKSNRPGEGVSMETPPPSLPLILPDAEV